MLRKRPKLPRQPMRPEEEPGVDKPAWYPNWQCFCCHDTGIVQNHLALMVIEGYDQKRDKMPLCQNPGCKAGKKRSNISNCLDTRLSPVICQELDMEERSDWQDTQQQPHQKRLDIRFLVEKMSMPKRNARDRTQEE